MGCVHGNVHPYIERPNEHKHHQSKKLFKSFLPICPIGILDYEDSFTSFNTIKTTIKTNVLDNVVLFPNNLCHKTS